LKIFWEKNRSEPCTGCAGSRVTGFIVCASHDPDDGIFPETLLRFALSRDVDIIIAGCTTPDEARTLAQAGSLPGMDQEEQDRLIKTVRPYAKRLAFYRGVI